MIENSLLAPAEKTSVTLIVNENGVSLLVGVPEMAPVEGFKLSPSGKFPLYDQLYGAKPPLAVNVWL